MLRDSFFKARLARLLVLISGLSLFVSLAVAGRRPRRVGAVFLNKLDP